MRGAVRRDWAGRDAQRLRGSGGATAGAPAREPGTGTGAGAARGEHWCGGVQVKKVPLDSLTHTLTHSNS